MFYREGELLLEKMLAESQATKATLAFSKHKMTEHNDGKKVMPTVKNHACKSKGPRKSLQEPVEKPVTEETRKPVRICVNKWPSNCNIQDGIVVNKFIANCRKENYSAVFVFIPK